MKPLTLRDLENDWPYGNRSALRELLLEAFTLGRRYQNASVLDGAFTEGSDRDALDMS